MDVAKIICTFDLQKTFEQMEKDFIEHMEYTRKAMESRKQRLEKTVIFVQEAAGSGLMLPTCYDMSNPVWDLNMDNKDDWRIIHDIVGELENYGVEPATEDLRKRLVYVTLRPVTEDFKHLRFRYQRKLKKDDKCKLVRQKSTYVSMVCG